MSSKTSPGVVVTTLEEPGGEGSAALDDKSLRLIATSSGQEIGTNSSLNEKAVAVAGATFNSRKRKRHSNNNNSNVPNNQQKAKRQNSFNNNNNGNKRQKNKQNIIICGMMSQTAVTSSSSSSGAAATGSTNNNNNHITILNPNLKSNQENFPAAFRHNFNKLNFKHLNNHMGRSRRIQVFSTISKYFLPDKRPPRKEMIIPPTKFLLGGNISDPLNLNSLQDEAIQVSLNAATPKSSPMTTPPKVEVIIPPNIHDPLHLLDPVDSIEYEKQLTSPMKKLAGSKANKNRHNNRNKKKRTALAKQQLKEIELEGNSVKVKIEPEDNNVPDNKSLEPGTSVKIKAGDPVEVKLEPVDKGVDKTPVMDGLRKRKISESSVQSSIKNKLRRMDSIDKIVSPVIPQPGARKRHIHCGPQGGPYRNRQRTQSVQSLDEEIIKTENEEVDKEVKVKLEILKVEPTLGEEETIPDITKEQKLPEGKGMKKAHAVDSKKKKNPMKFQYGNYDRYYGYRNLNQEMDVRLKVFMQNPFLFRDKDILDIGCNVGHMTTAVAKFLAPKSILGIDIDPQLIHRAKQNVSLFVRVPEFPMTGGPPLSNVPSTSSIKMPPQSTKQRNNKKAKSSATKHQSSQHPFAEFFPQSFPLCYGLIPDMVEVKDASGKATEGEDKKQQNNTPSKPATVTTASVNPLFPKNVRFQAGNYVLMDEKLLASDQHQKYDMILCLSVTKWIHLNFGDTGLKMMFRRIFNQLRPGGKLILEAQNWASYKKKKKLTDTILRNYNSIEFFPNKFHEYLLSPEVGFSHSYPLGIPRHLSKGFRRPIQLYVKGDFTPSQVMWSDAYHPQTPYTPYRGIYAEVMCPPPRFNSVWGGGPDCTPYRSTHGMSTSQYYNPMETDTYLPSYETEVSNRRYCFSASPLYSAAWSPPANSEVRKVSIMTPPASMTPSTSTSFPGSGSGTNTPSHVYPPINCLDDDTEEESQTKILNGSAHDSSSPSHISPEH